MFAYRVKFSLPVSPDALTSVSPSRSLCLIGYTFQNRFWPSTGPIVISYVDSHGDWFEFSVDADSVTPLGCADLLDLDSFPPCLDVPF